VLHLCRTRGEREDAQQIYRLFTLFPFGNTWRAVRLAIYRAFLASSVAWVFGDEYS
jgi:hypothetical protein